jgi:pyruvate formate lyase activating enzyme
MSDMLRSSPFCHNSSLVSHVPSTPNFTEDEVLSFLEKRGKILDGVCITGGEPLLQDIKPFLRRIRKLGMCIKLDHNGTKPQVLAELIEEGLVDYVAIDIKNSPTKYGETVGVPRFDITPVLETIQILKNNTIPYEFRTTVVQELHSAEDFVKIGELIQGAPRYVLQQFVDSDDLVSPYAFHAYPPKALQQFANIVSPYVKEVSIRGI